MLEICLSRERQYCCVTFGDNTCVFGYIKIMYGMCAEGDRSDWQLGTSSIAQSKRKILT